MSKPQEKTSDKNVYREKSQHSLPSQPSEHSLQSQQSFSSVISEEHATTTSIGGSIPVMIAELLKRRSSLSLPASLATEVA